MRKNNKNITAVTDATNRDPLHYISPQINEQQGSKNSTQHSQGTEYSKIFLVSLFPSFFFPPLTKIIAEYHKLIMGGRVGGRGNKGTVFVSCKM